MRLLLLLITIVLMYFFMAASLVTSIGWLYSKAKHKGPKRWTNAVYICLIGLVISYLFLYLQNTELYNSLQPVVNWSDAK